jgi:hypothetical protein
LPWLPSWSGFARRISFEKRGGIAPAAPTLELAGPGLERPDAKLRKCSAGSPSEVTALETRHWITSFHC